MELEAALKLAPGSPELKTEIEERRKSLGECVGWLYTDILSGEITTLMERYVEQPLPPMSAEERVDKLIQAKNRVYSYLLTGYEKVRLDIERKTNCIHIWKRSGHGYQCSLCTEYSGTNSELNELIAETLRLS